MSNNPLPQTAFMSHEEFELLQQVESHLNFYLSRSEISAQAKIYADEMGIEISQAYRVMLKGSDRDEVMDGDVYWNWAKDQQMVPKYYTEGTCVMIPYYFYGWGLCIKDAETIEDDSRPEDFPEYTIGY